MGCQEAMALVWVPGFRLGWGFEEGNRGWGRACGVAHVGLGRDED